MAKKLIGCHYMGIFYENHNLIGFALKKRGKIYKTLFELF
jgi:hypothetical protein